MGFICNYLKPKTVEEIVAGNSALMSDAQKAQYWYELSQNIFAARVPGRLKKVETRYLARPIQKTGIICPDCYRETDSLIWGVHKK